LQRTLFSTSDNTLDLKIASVSIATTVETNKDMSTSLNENEAVEENASIDLATEYGKNALMHLDHIVKDCISFSLRFIGFKK
jgi:hypothetical protein